LYGDKIIDTSQRFSIKQSKQSIPCRYFLKKQICKYGIYCKFSHSELPISKKYIRLCKNSKYHGSCDDEKCRFSHCTIEEIIPKRKWPCEIKTSFRKEIYSAIQPDMFGHIIYQFWTLDGIYFYKDYELIEQISINSICKKYPFASDKIETIRYRFDKRDAYLTSLFLILYESIKKIPESILTIIVKFIDYVVEPVVEKMIVDEW